MRRILVTGASGLIGRSAACALRDAGHRVTALLLDKADSLPEPGLHFLYADLLQEESRKTIAGADADAVVHCAAVSPGGFQTEDAARCARDNAIMDERVISCCRDRDALLVYLSGTSVYGAGPGPWREDSPLAPMGPYVEQKATGEKLSMDRLSKWLVLRVSSPYGPNQRKPTVLSTFIENALGGKDLLYHGSGARAQDFISAEDVARAVALALAGDHRAEVINIASGQPLSMKDLALLVLKTVSSSTSRALPSGMPDPQEDYRAVIATEKAARVLDWSPSLSLAEGLRRWVGALENRT